MIRARRRDSGGSVDRAYAAALTAAVAGDGTAAAATLAAVLSTMDPETAAADAVVVEAAMLLAQLLTGGGDAPRSAEAWAQYALTAASQLCGWQHQTAVRAARVLAGVQWDRGEYADAHDTYSLIAAAVYDTSLDDACRAAAQADSAAHAAGRCSQAIGHLTAVWQAWQPAHDVTDPAGLDFVYRLTAMLAACGRLGEARQRFRDALPALPAPGTPLRDFERLRAGVLLDQATRIHELVCLYRRGALYRLRPTTVAAARPTDRSELLP